ncbi:MAG: N-methyl-L-tryptophan oxidase [Isosphaeraceae bacterium]
MDAEHHRNVVIGAGVVGSAAARHLALRGEPVLLVEQFAPGHDRGSSHGLARITRHSYADEYHARLMIEAFRGWRELEADAGCPFYLRTGGVSACPAAVDYVDQVSAALEAVGVPHRRMTGGEIRRALPMFAPEDPTDAVFEPDAGLLASSRIVEAQLALASAQGALFRPRCKVDRIDLEGERPALVGDGFRIEADRLIVAAGAWAAGLLPSWRGKLRATRQQVLYLQGPISGGTALGRLPVWIYVGTSEGQAYYGMPDFLGGGAKAARHSGPEVDPDHAPRGVDPGYVAEIRAFLRGFLPMLADAPMARSETCLYTMSPDEMFLVGPLPDRPDVLLASACSGHGFKFGDLVGRALADLAIDGRTDLPIGPWSPARSFGACP